MERLVRLLLVFAACLLPASGFAALPQVNGYYVDIKYGIQPTAEAACLAVPLSTIGANYEFLEVRGTPPNQSCRWQGPAAGVTRSINVVGGQCPAGSSPSGSVCVCNAGLEENQAGTACEAPQRQCTFGDVGPMGWFDGGASIDGGPPMTVCSEGCRYIFQGSFPEGSAIVDGKKHYFARGGYVGWGTQCEVGEQTPGAPEGRGELPEDTCGPGKIPGVVNGQTVCTSVPDSSGGGTGEGSGEGQGAGNDANKPKTDNKETKETTSETRTNPDGSTTTITTTTTRGAGGGTTTETTETTTSADGKTTTTKTTTSGAAVDKKAEDEKKKEPTKCEKNPLDEGCAGTPKEITNGGLYTEKTKTFSKVLTDARNTLQASPIGASITGFFSVSGGGSCPAVSGTIPYLNTTFTFDAFCSPMAANVLAVLRGVLLLLAAFWAFRIAME